MAIAAMILGILSFILGVLSLFVAYIWIPGLLLGIGAIVLAAISMKNPDKKGMKIVGLVFGIIGTVLSSVGLVCLVICAAGVSAVSSGLGY